MRKWLVALATSSALIGGSAHASATGPVLVTSVTPTNYGMVYFIHGPGVRSPAPSCGAANGTRFAFNITTPSGQAMLSTLLTAFATHKPVTVMGTGSCDAAAADTESVVYFMVTD